MPETIALDALLPALAGRPLLAWRGTRGVSGAEFLARVGAWHAALDLRARSTLALAHGDAIEFAAALYAAWLRQLTVLVPGDTLPATVAALAADVNAFAGEFGAATTHAEPAAAGVPMADALPLGLSSTLILQTSGSTGTPLRVPKTLRQLDAEVRTLEAGFGGPLGTARIAATVSHQHIYGLLFRVLWPLASGRAFESQPHAYLESVAPLLASGPVALVASPAHLKRLPAGIDWHPVGRQLSALFSSGGPLDAQSARDCMWIRKTFLDSELDHGAVVVHGHSISPAPELRHNRIGIDTGAYRSGVLSCLLLEGDQRRMLQTGVGSVVA